jgi:hypothetical protein
MKNSKRFALRTIPLPLLIALACDQPQDLGADLSQATTSEPPPAWASEAFQRIDLAATHLTKDEWLARGMPEDHPAMRGPTAYIKSGFGIAESAERQTRDEVENDPRIDQVNAALAEARDTFRELYAEGRIAEAMELERSLLDEAGLGAVHYPDDTPMEERRSRISEIAAEVR